MVKNFLKLCQNVEVDVGGAGHRVRLPNMSGPLGGGLIQIVYFVPRTPYMVSPN